MEANAAGRWGKLYGREQRLAHSELNGFTKWFNKTFQTVFAQVVNWKQVLPWLASQPASSKNCLPALEFLWTAWVAPRSLLSGLELILKTVYSQTLLHLRPVLLLYLLFLFFLSLFSLSLFFFFFSFSFQDAVRK